MDIYYIYLFLVATIQIISIIISQSGGNRASSLPPCSNELLWMCVMASTQEAKENEKIKEKLTKWNLPLIHQSLDMFDLPRGTGDDSKKVCVGD